MISNLTHSSNGAASDIDSLDNHDFDVAITTLGWKIDVCIGPDFKVFVLVRICGDTSHRTS